MWYYKAKDRVIMKVHGGMGAALLSENRVRRGGKRFEFQPLDVGLAHTALLGGSRRIAVLGGRSGRKVHGGQRLGAGGGRSGRKVHGGRQKHILIWGGRSSRKVHGGNRMYVRAGGSRRKVHGGSRRIALA